MWSRLRIQDERRVEGRWCAMELARPGAAAERLDGLQSTSAWPSSARLSRYACILGVVTHHPCLSVGCGRSALHRPRVGDPSPARRGLVRGGPGREIHFSSGR